MIQTLENNNDECNTLFLFKAYLQFFDKNLSESLDEDKNTFFLQALHSIQLKLDLQIKENNISNNITNEHKNIFSKIINHFSPKR